MTISRRLDFLFLWLRSKPFFHRFSWFTRLLLMAGFFPTGLVKLLGRPFTILGPDTPIGAFFEAMHQTGLFWRFIGLSQIAAAVLVVIPACAHLGAAVFFPIILNIFVITVALHFKGTPVVTGLILLAVLYLLFWDYHRFRVLIFEKPRPLPQPLPDHRLDRWERIGFGMFAVGLLLTFLGVRSLFPAWAGPVPIIAGFLGGLLALVRFLTRGKGADRPMELER